MSDVFKLLTLPSVAFRQIVGGIDPTDLFELTQCSTKTMRCLQYEKVNKVFKIDIDFERRWVDIRGVHKYYVLEKKDGDIVEATKKFNGQEVPIAEAETKAFDTFWPRGQQRRGTKMIAENFIKTLGVGSLELVAISTAEPAHEILNWVEKTKLTMENFDLNGAPADQVVSLAHRIFSTNFMANIKNSFVSLIEVPEDFKPSSWALDKVVSLRKFHAQSAHWLKAEHLRTLNVTAIILYQCTLSEDDIHDFLAAWKAGNYNELTYLSLNMKLKFVDFEDEANESLNFENIIRDLADPATIDNTVEGQQSVTFSRPTDGKTIEIDLDDGGRHFAAFIH